MATTNNHEPPHAMLKDEFTEDDDDQYGLGPATKTALRVPLRALTSRPARRTYLTATLLLLASSALALFALTAYILLYRAYIPTSLTSTTPVHLIFDPAPIGTTSRPHTYIHPHGIADLPSAGLAPGTPYDVRVRVTLPRSAGNVAAGNFMVDLAMLPDAAAVVVPRGGKEEDAALARAQRSAVLTYRSGVVEMVRWARQLPLFVLGWRREAETLEVGMLEGVVFSRGWRGAPRRVRVEVRAATVLQVYEVVVVVEARLNGLKWFMWRWRVTAAAVMVVAFWMVEVVVALAAWGVARVVFARPGLGMLGGEKKGEVDGDEGTAKEEESEGMSDTSRVFPSIGRQPPVRYSSPKVKEEEDVEEAKPALPIHATAAEADDEDEDLDQYPDNARGFDSGIGTSMESSGGGVEGVRKRKGRSSFGGGRYGSSS